MELQNKEDSAGLILAAGRKLMVKFLQLLFYVLLVNECQSRAERREVMDLGHRVAKGYFKHLPWELRFPLLSFLR